MTDCIPTEDRPVIPSPGEYNYTLHPAPQGACPVCWHRNGRMISVACCKDHTNDTREFYRLKEQGVGYEN